MREPTAAGTGPPIEEVRVSAYTIPTETDVEQDGTLTWDDTTIVVVEVEAGGQTGLGYTYEHEACGTLVDEKLAGVVEGQSAMEIRARWFDMYRSVRNIGRPGIASRAISAVDMALWDLKARLLDVSLVTLLDPAHDAVPVYGSGGFTNYSIDQLTEQLTRWVDEGLPRVKMKVGRHMHEDVSRVEAAREAIGDDVELFVDANGAYTRKQALLYSNEFAQYDVCWHEEPVSSDDLEGLQFLRDRGPAGMDITAGEYGDHLQYFRDMLNPGAVDCLQADVGRCGGFTAFLDVIALCREHTIDISTHTAPQLSVHAATAATHLRHCEWFFTHNRIEDMIFDGCLEPDDDGLVWPDRSRPGNGLELKRTEAERYAA
ncbi:MAG: enolase C-terminal domain-like protein [Nitriliruptorales bacterium]|nr:enolase C-terminal domain-like protein [Nitriliruptorales bacterium]